MFCSQNWIFYVKRVRTKKLRTFATLLVTFLLLWVLYIQSNSVLLYQTNVSLKETTRWPKVISRVVDDENQSKIIAELYPNLPITYWMESRDDMKEMFYKNSSCAPFPNLLRLNIDDTYWQTVDLSNFSTIHIYSAYYDTRKLSLPENYVRIITMINRTINNFQRSGKLFCHLWYDDELEPEISPVIDVDYGWKDYWNSHLDGYEATYLLGCVAPNKANPVPAAVSLVENPCDKANNLIRVIFNNETKKQNVSVCVKGLEFSQNDVSIRLVEWIEFTLLMGVDKIYFYHLDLHPNAKKVLDYYIKAGKADVRKATLPPGQPNIPYIRHSFLVSNIQKSLNEPVLYNDCFYRLMYKYEYVTLLDIDEIIVPMETDNWNNLLMHLEKNMAGKRFASLSIRHTYFLDSMTPEGSYTNIPSYMHILQHVHRSFNFTPPLYFVKSFFNTSEVIVVHNHLPIVHSNRSEFSLDVSTNFAQMNHYRRELIGELFDKNFYETTIKDTRLWDFKHILIPRVSNVLEKLNL